MLHVKKAVKQSCTDERSAWDVPVNPPGWKSARTSAFNPRLVSCVCKAEPPISGDGERWSSKREMVTLKGKQNAETAGVLADSPTGAGGSRGQVPLSTTSLGDQKFPKAICSHRVSALWICFLLRHQSRAAYSHIHFVSLLFLPQPLSSTFRLFLSACEIT